MLPIAAVKYIFLSLVIVLSMFFGIQGVFAREDRREQWRSILRRRIYFQRDTFKKLTKIGGWICIAISLSIAYFEILDLIYS